MFNQIEQSIKEKAVKEGGEIIIKRFKGIPEYQVRSGDHEYYEKHKWQKGKIVESIKKRHLDKKELQSRKVKRQYGMHMTEQRKMQGELYIRDWFITPRHTDEDGKVTLNLHKIFDPALVMELIKFNKMGNFDRVMALMIGMYHTRELYNSEVMKFITNLLSSASL